MEPIKPRDNDKPLTKTQATAEAGVTTADLGRALGKWRRRVPDFEKRLREAAQGGQET